MTPLELARRQGYHHIVSILTFSSGLQSFSFGASTTFGNGSSSFGHSASNGALGPVNPLNFVTKVPVKQGDGNIHNLARQGDIDGIRALVDTNPLDVNKGEIDVSISIHYYYDYSYNYYCYYYYYYPFVGLEWPYSTSFC